MNNKKSIQWILLLASSMTVMAGAIIAPALPAINKNFADYPGAEILSKLVLTLPGLFIAVSSPVAGWIIDRFGRLKLLISSLFIYAVAGTTGFYLENLYWILAGRAFLGLAVGGIMNSATTLIGDYFQGEERNNFLGTQSAFMAFGGTVYILAAGALADINWHFPFLMYSFALILVPFAIRVLFEPKIEKQDISGDHSEDTVPKGIMWLVYFTAFMGMVLFYMIPVQSTYLFDGFTNASNTLIGVAVASTTLFAALSSMNYGTIKKHFSHYRIYAFCFFMMAMGYGVVSFAQSYTVALTGVVVAGIGAGLLMPNSNLCIVTIAPTKLRGRMIGGLTMAVFLGQFMSPILIQPIVEVTSLQQSFIYVALFQLIFSMFFLGLESKQIFARYFSQAR